MQGQVPATSPGDSPLVCDDLNKILDMSVLNRLFIFSISAYQRLKVKISECLLVLLRCYGKQVKVCQEKVGFIHRGWYSYNDIVYDCLFHNVVT